MTNCIHCHSRVTFRERGGWMNYADGLGSPEEKCPKCGQKTPTSRKYWYDMSFAEKMRTYSKLLIWLPLGTVAGSLLIYLLLATRNDDFLSDAAMTHREAVEVMTNEPIIFLLFSVTISLSANITSLRLAIRSRTPRRRGWI